LKKVKIVGVAHSKLRNSIGCVGIEVDPEEHICYVKMAKHWSRDDINKIAPELSAMYHSYEWNRTIVDQMIGEHLIQDFRKGGIPLRIVYIKKKIAEVSDIRRVVTMDLIEMVQFTLSQKILHKIKFPEEDPSPQMIELKDQIALYAEATTEAGGIDYYAPGDELDDLTKGLMLAMLAARPLMTDSAKIICGPLKPKQGVSLEDMSSIIDPVPKMKKRIRGI